MSGERLLAHGPGLADLDDLLCFDRLVYPVTMALVRPSSLPPGMAGYPLREPLPEAVQERLVEAGLIQRSGMLLALGLAQGFADQPAGSVDALVQGAQQNLQELMTVIGRVAFSTLDTPASDNELLAWQSALDANVKELAGAGTRHGHRITAKYHIEDVTRTLRPGWTPVLGIVFPAFPRLHGGEASLDAGISLLADEATRQRRSRLFDGCHGIAQTADAAAEDLRARVAGLAESCREYADWLRRSGLCAGARTVELLIACDESQVADLVQAGVPEALAGQLQLRRRGLSQDEVQDRPPGSEIAFISHARRRFRQLLPG